MARDKRIRIDMTEPEYAKVELLAKTLGYKYTTAFIRDVMMLGEFSVSFSKPQA